MVKSPTATGLMAIASRWFRRCPTEPKYRLHANLAVPLRHFDRIGNQFLISGWKALSGPVSIDCHAPSPIH
jgi:hypothetical protein